MNFDNIGPFHIAKVRPATALVYPQDRLQGIQGADMNLQIIRKELANAGPLASFINRRGIAGFEEQLVGFRATFRIAPEERLHVALPS